MEKACFSLEWKILKVVDDERDESEEDWLVQGRRSETGSLYQR